MINDVVENPDLHDIHNRLVAFRDEKNVEIFPIETAEFCMNVAIGNMSANSAEASLFDCAQIIPVNFSRREKLGVPEAFDYCPEIITGNLTASKLYSNSDTAIKTNLTDKWYLSSKDTELVFTAEDHDQFHLWNADVELAWDDIDYDNYF